MKKIVITILALLLTPTIAGAADELTFDADTTLEVNGFSVTILSGGKVDQMVVNSTNIVFSLSANSGVTIRSSNRYQLSNNLGLDISCGTDYSQISANGSDGATLTLSVDGTICSGTVGGGSSPTPTGGSASPSTPTTPTTTTGQVTATASGGGKTTLTTSENTTASVSLPIGAVTASTNILIAAESKDTVTGSKPAPSNRSVVGGYIYNFTGTAGTENVSSFSKTLTLTFTYTDEQISGLDEANLRVFYWKESTSQWVALPTTVNASTNTLTAETDHFTYFAIMGLSEGEEDEDLVEEESSQEEAISVSDGDLIRNSNAEGMAQFDIYIVKLINNKKFKRLILSPHVFESYEHFDKNGNGSPWDDVIEVNKTTMNDLVVSDLIRAVGDTKVYKLSASGDGGTKQWLNMTAEKFVSDGYDADSIYEINATDRDAYAAGENIGDEGVSETIIINTSFLRIRSIPSTSGNVLGEVNEGDVYNLLDEENGWYKITANGVTGWCYGANGDYASKQ